MRQPTQIVELDLWLVSAGTAALAKGISIRNVDPSFGIVLFKLMSPPVARMKARPYQRPARMTMSTNSLWPHGVVIITPDNVNPDGSLGMKFGWYLTAAGFLMIIGRRLDAPAPQLSADISQGDAPSSGFRASGVGFPTEGCWQVTGRVGRVALAFVTFVIKGHCDLNAVPIRCVANRAR
jgi:hypothetical protein